MKRTVLLDMDGVISDFIGAVRNVFGEPKQEIYDTYFVDGVYYKKRTYNLYLEYGITEEQFWDRINDCGISFWRNMNVYEDGMYIYNKLVSNGYDVIICTTPQNNANCVAGKLLWIMDKFGNNFKNFIMTPRKDTYANHKNAILIDDHDDNIEIFSMSGGKTILFPRYWNKNSHISIRPDQYVFSKLNAV